MNIAQVVDAYLLHIKDKMKTNHLFKLATIYTLILFYLSLRPIPEEIGNLFEFQDKLMHLISYILLMLLYLCVIPIRGVALILAIGIGVIIEHLQALTGYRYFESGDIIANTIGVLLALPLHYYLKVYFPNQISCHPFEKD